MPIFSNSKINNITYITGENAYQTVINNIRMILYGTAIFLIVPTILLNYVSIYIYNLEFTPVIAIILGVLFIIRILDAQKCCVIFETTNKVIPSSILSTLINIVIYILCLLIAINFQVSHVTEILSIAVQA